MFESWGAVRDCGDDRDLSTPIRRRPCWRSWRGDGRAAGAAGRVGVSPPYDDLRATSQALRPARIALHGALDGRRVVVFGRDPLSVAAASAPDIMPRLARTVLAALDDLPAEDRALLLDTFGAWLDSGGSAEQTARELFVQPNTVRYRLRHLEERTGRSLSDPRWIAEPPVRAGQGSGVPGRRAPGCTRVPPVLS